MINPITLAELAKTRQQDLLKEAENWRLVSQASGKKPDNTGILLRIMADVVKHGIELFAELRFKILIIQR